MKKILLLGFLILLSRNVYAQQSVSICTETTVGSVTECLPASSTTPVPVGVYGGASATSGYVLTSNGPGALATFQAGGGGGGSGTVTSVTFTGDGTVLSSTPSSAVTTSGTVTASLATATAKSVLSNNTGSTAAWADNTSLVLSGTVTDTGEIITSTSASAVTIGTNGATNPSVELSSGSNFVNGIQIEGSGFGVAPSINWIGTDTNGNGLNININAGTATASAGPGGAINLTSGAGSAGIGGAINIISGAGLGAGGGNHGGNIAITVGAPATTANDVGGTLTLTSGSAHSAANGGLLELIGGAGGTTGVGSEIELLSGIGGSTSGNSGLILLQPGTVTSGTVGYIESNGVTLIGTSAPISTAELTVLGSINQSTEKSCSTGLTSDVNGTINGCVASDPSLKKNIVDLGYSDQLIESVIDGIQVINYQWSDPDKYDDKSHIGFNAHQILALEPQLTKSAGNGLVGIDNSAMEAFIMRDLQHIHVEVRDLSNELMADHGAFPFHRCGYVWPFEKTLCAD